MKIWSMEVCMGEWGMGYERQKIWSIEVWENGMWGTGD